jgi:hypothetical protein
LPLADQAVPLPGKLLVRGLAGGTNTWEAWDLRESLPEFEDRPQEQQDWLLATWRTMKKLERIQAIDAARDMQ